MHLMHTRLLISLFLGCPLVLASCAQSPIDESLAWDDALDGDDEPAANDDDDSSSEGAEDDDDDESSRDDEPSDDDGVTMPEFETGMRDAGIPRDAATLPGSGESAIVRSDAATPTTTPSTTPARDAGSTQSRDAGTSSAPTSGEGCRSNADCRISCFPIGIAPCCRANRTCGCSWAPGAYCL